jgi:hypothetical protein
VHGYWTGQGAIVSRSDEGPMQPKSGPSWSRERSEASEPGENFELRRSRKLVPQGGATL